MILVAKFRIIFPDLCKQCDYVMNIFLQLRLDPSRLCVLWFLCVFMSLHVYHSADWFGELHKNDQCVGPLQQKTMHNSFKSQRRVLASWKWTTAAATCVCQSSDCSCAASKSCDGRTSTGASLDRPWMEASPPRPSIAHWTTTRGRREDRRTATANTAAMMWRWTWKKMPLTMMWLASKTTTSTAYCAVFEEWRTLTVTTTKQAEPNATSCEFYLDTHMTPTCNGWGYQNVSSSSRPSWLQTSTTDSPVVPRWRISTARWRQSPSASPLCLVIRHHLLSSDILAFQPLAIMFFSSHCFP